MKIYAHHPSLVFREKRPLTYQTKLKSKLVENKIFKKWGNLGFILRWDVDFWVKNEGWWVGLGGLGKIGRKKMEKNEEKWRKK